MKVRVFLSTLLAFLLINAQAQFGKIPLEATNAFKTKYPDAQNVQWKSRFNSYKADFDLNNTHCAAEFNSKAQWTKTECRLTYDKLPTEVSDGFHKSLYTGWEYTEIVKVEEKGKDVMYRIRVKKSDLEKKYLYFSAAGQLQKESITL